MATSPRLQSREAMQADMDNLVASSSWNGSIWAPFQSQYVPRADLLYNRTVLLMGDSTVRFLFEQRPWAGGGVWKDHAFECDASRGIGCADCVLKCTGAAPKKLAWSDWIGTRTATKTHVWMSYKPQLWTEADALALSSRFCDTPPNLLVVAKGLHDACFTPCGLPDYGPDHHWRSKTYHRDNCTAANYGAWAERQLRTLAKALSCLPPPPRTLVLLRTPLAADPTSRRSRHGARDCVDVSRQVDWLRETARVMRALHSEGVFGDAMLLDANAITSAALREPRAPKTMDGHHYPPVMNQLQARLFEWALERAEFGVVPG